MIRIRTYSTPRCNLLSVKSGIKWTLPFDLAHTKCNNLIAILLVIFLCYQYYRLPLVQCKQKFSAMDMQYKENLREWINEHARKYKLAELTLNITVE